MIAWRLCRRLYADLSGNGARTFGGRWNSRGRPVVYLAEHPALAALEARLHLDLPFELLPADYVLMRVFTPDAPSAGLDVPAATLRVPSVLVPHSWNILLNPLHPEAAQAEVLGNEPFAFDPRLWQPLAGEG